MKFIVCTIMDKCFGIPVTNVISIEKISEITPIPNSAPYILGLTPYRDIVIPLVDMGQILGSPGSEHSEASRVIIVLINELAVGLVVDFADKIVDVDQSLIQSVDISGCKFSVLYHEDRLVLILEITRFLNKEDLLNLQLIKEAL